jgi:hypothetical protein
LPVLGLGRFGPLQRADLGALRTGIPCQEITQKIHRALISDNIRKNSKNKFKFFWIFQYFYRLSFRYLSFTARVRASIS